jgi:glycosyltransferase involved in cell wall biosynthesis
VPLTVLINAGPWLAVPPPGYGGIENVLACLIPELRRRGVRVVLCSVEESSITVDEHRWAFGEGQYQRLAARSGVEGITRAHMAVVLRTMRELRDVDLVHDHLEVVGPRVLAAMDGVPPVLQTLHWDLGKHPDFYGGFDGRGRVFFNAVSNAQLRTAPANLRAQTLGVVHLGVDLAAHRLAARKTGDYLVLGRITPYKGQATAARLCKELGLPLVMAGPVAGFAAPCQLLGALEDAAGPLHRYQDVRYYLDAVRPFEDGGRIRWVGTVGGAAKQRLLGAARAVLMPITWEEPGATAALEALACGTTVIALRRGALAEIVEHGVNGFLADDEDEFASLVPRAGEIDPQECRRSVERRFSAGMMADGYLQLYRKVLARAGRGRSARPLVDEHGLDDVATAGGHLGEQGGRLGEGDHVGDQVVAER